MIRLVFAARRVVVDVGDAVDVAGGHQLVDASGDRRHAGLIRKFGDDDLEAAVVVLLDARLGAHLHRAATGLIRVDDPGATEDVRPGREVGTGDVLHQVLDGGVGMVDEVDDGVDGLAEVVRRDVRRHAHGDALAAVDEQVREPGRQDERFLGRAVVVRDHVDGVFVDVREQLHGQRVEAALRVARSGGAEVGRAVVAVEVDQRVTQRERLGHAHECGVDGRVAVRVEAGHGVAGDARTLDVTAIGAEPLLLHVPDDPAVHRLEPVAHVRQRPRHDDRHRILEERRLHLVGKRNRQHRIIRRVTTRGISRISHERCPVVVKSEEASREARTK